MESNAPLREEWHTVNRKKNSNRNKSIFQRDETKTTKDAMQSKSRKPKTETDTKKSKPKSTPKPKDIDPDAPKNVYATDATVLTHSSIAPVIQHTVLGGAVQYRLDKVIPDATSERAFPEIAQAKIPVQVFENKEKTILVAFTSPDHGVGEVAVYSTKDLRVLGSFIERGNNFLHWVDFHPSRPLVALTFIFKDVERDVENRQYYNVVLFDFGKNKYAEIQSHYYYDDYYYGDEQPDYQDDNFVFDAMIFTANLTLDELKKGTRHLPQSDDESDEDEKELDWTKFAKKKKEKINRKEQRTRNLVNTDSLIFSCSQEQIRGRRRFYGNLRWYRVDLKKWHLTTGNKVEPTKEYYRNIRRIILNCKNSTKCPPNYLSKLAQDVRMKFEPLTGIETMAVMEDPILGREDRYTFYVIKTDSYKNISLWNMKSGTCEKEYSLKNRYKNVLLSPDEKTIYLSGPIPKKADRRGYLGGHAQLSPFATFSTSSFFNNFFISEKISYSEEVVYTVAGPHGIYWRHDVPDIVISHSDDFYLIHPYHSSHKKVVGNTLPEPHFNLDFGKYDDDTIRQYHWINASQTLHQFYILATIHNKATYHHEVHGKLYSVQPGGKPVFLCKMPRSVMSLDYLILHENGVPSAIIHAVRESSVMIYCYSISTGARRWSKQITSYNSKIKLREFPALKSVIVATEQSFTIISLNGDLVSHPQPVVVDGVFRTISDVVVHYDTVIVGLTDGRMCCYAPAMLSLVQLCARQIIMSNNTKQIDEICKRAPHDVVVRLEEAYYQYKKLAF